MEAYCRKLHDAIVPRVSERSTVVFSSFDKRPLAFFRQAFPEAERMLITGEPCGEATIREAQALGVKRLACTWDGSARSCIFKLF